jgi:hypothetical protein
VWACVQQGRYAAIGMFWTPTARLSLRGSTNHAVCRLVAATCRSILLADWPLDFCSSGLSPSIQSRANSWLG